MYTWLRERGVTVETRWGIVKIVRGIDGISWGKMVGFVWGKCGIRAQGVSFPHANDHKQLLTFCCFNLALPKEAGDPGRVGG